MRYHYYERYLNGEYEQVTTELIAVGSDIYTNDLFYADAQSVAYAIVTRIRKNIQIIIPRLQSLGYQWEFPDEIMRPLNWYELDAYKRSLKCGKLPMLLDMLYTQIGWVNFEGSHPLLNTFLIDPEEDIVTDPLCIYFDMYIINDVEAAFDAGQTDEIFYWEVFPDLELKAGYGGDMVVVKYPCDCFDTPLVDIEYPSLIAYLRESLKFGGFPGLREYMPLPEATQQMLDFLTEGCVDF